MLYDVRLRMAYEYETPAAAARQMLRMFPRDIPGLQRAIATDLDIAPGPDERRVFQDFFGNQTHDVLIKAPHRALDVRVSARIERLPGGWPDASAQLADIAETADTARSLAPDAPHHFLGASNYARPSRALAAYAAACAPPGIEVHEAVRRIGERLHADMTFDPGATTVSTPHEEAFARRRGVCQDFTHVMIACLRSIGVPAGYVSGLLRTNPPKGPARLSGADAMHAWVRAWCGPHTGWVEYDPTNALKVALDHIVIAIGRDYFDVSPIRGIMRTTGAQTCVQEVDVLPRG